MTRCSRRHLLRCSAAQTLRCSDASFRHASQTLRLFVPFANSVLAAAGKPVAGRNKAVGVRIKKFLPFQSIRIEIVCKGWHGGEIPMIEFAVFCLLFEEKPDIPERPPHEPERFH